MKKAPRYPKGWSEERVQRVMEFYERQSEAEAIAEDEAAYGSSKQAMMSVPVQLVAEVRELIARRAGKRSR